jgi:tRNA pseudouridine13 synthase
LAQSQFNLEFAYALGKPKGGAKFRVRPEDFIVEEDLGFIPDGEGEHVLVHLSKTGQNTHWVAQQLAAFAGINDIDIGYCGRKDRHAQCSQWFSLYLPGNKIIQWEKLAIPAVVVHSHTRHSHKLRPGQHRANQFRIVLRDLDDLEEVKCRVAKIAAGVPNYFGEQRFGRDGNNLIDAEGWASRALTIRNKKQRGLIISATRSYLFNCVLSRRVAADNWRQCLLGDTDASPTGPLWGRGRSLVNGETANLEAEVLADNKDWCRALEHCGLAQERRPLVCVPKKLAVTFGQDQLQLSFELLTGQFATTVLREIAQLQNAASGEVIE